MNTRVGITGQAGFIGTHLYQYLGLFSETIVRIPFEDQWFTDPDKMDSFVKQCDVIVHLAAMNRGDLEEIYRTNLLLVQQLIDALNRTNARPTLLYSSSTQEARDNLYGKSKREGRELLENWGKETGTKVYGLIIPNVFGPFGKPFYNSVVPTFCVQILKKEAVTIQADAEVTFIYVNDLVEHITNILLSEEELSVPKIAPTGTISVSGLKELLESFYVTYVENKCIPSLSNKLQVALFNTFKSYLPTSFYPVNLPIHEDDRGLLCEVLKTGTAGQVFYSVTKPGITRGNHFHRRKLERFCVLAGEALIRLRRIGTDEIVEYPVNGKDTSFVDIPVFYTHNITNTGNTELITLFWTNEIYDPSDPDTWFEKV